MIHVRNLSSEVQGEKYQTKQNERKMSDIWQTSGSSFHGFQTTKRGILLSLFKNKGRYLLLIKMVAEFLQYGEISNLGVYKPELTVVVKMLIFYAKMILHSYDSS